MATVYLYDVTKFRPNFDTRAELLADATMSYSDTGGKYRVDAGDVVFAENQSFTVAASGASDQHETTAGGVKLYEAGPNFSSRARLVSWVSAGYSAADGAVYTADGILYEAESGNTTISDLPGWKVISSQKTNRNILINGDMRIIQRTASKTGITTSGYHVADRWNLDVSSLGTWTMAQDTDVPAGTGFPTSLKLTCTSADASPAASDYLILQQKIEGLNCQQLMKGSASAKDIAVSFWVKSDKTGTYIVEIYDNDNTRHICEAVTISASGTWEKKNINLPADATGTLGDDNLLSLSFNLWLGAGSDYTSGTLATAWAAVTAANRAVGQANLGDSTNYLSITGVQMEAVSSGALGSDFEFTSLDTALMRCRRYYWQVTGNGSDYIAVFNGWALANNDVRCSVRFPVEMRAAPTVAEAELRTQGFGAAANNISLVTEYYADTQSLAIAFAPDAGTPFTGGSAGEIGLNNTTSAYIAFNAEL